MECLAFLLGLKGGSNEFFTYLTLFRGVISFTYQKILLGDRVPLKSGFKMPLILSLILSLKLPLMCSWCVLHIDLDGPAPFMFIYGWWWCKVIFTSNWTFFGYVRLCWSWVGFVTILGGKKIWCVIFTGVFITRPIVGNRKNIGTSVIVAVNRPSGGQLAVT